MQQATVKYLLIFLATFFGTGTLLQAQLCTGSLGDPVVNITFGAGNNPGPSQSTTTYTYLTSDCPSDGQYVMRNSSISCFMNTWHSLPSDHTGDANGYFMLVNASFSPGDFYVQTVSGLCGNTTYEFATWVINVLKPTSCNGNGIKPNLTFSIETTSGNKLASFNSGDIESGFQPQWKQYGTFFTTPANVSSVVVRLTNNAPGGCGNDIALDDITFRPCGANITATIEGANSDQLQVCAGGNASRKFLATIPGGYVNPELQWQQSKDNGQTWEAIAGATAVSYQWNESVPGTFLYRALVAEKGNINAPSCRVASKTIKVTVSEIPQFSDLQNVTVCEGIPINFEVGVQLKDTTGLRFSWSGATLPGFTQSERGTIGEKLFRINKAKAALADSGQFRANVISGAGCQASRDFRLEVLPKPVVDFTIAGASCDNDPVEIESTIVNQIAIEKYSWQWGNGSTSSDATIVAVLGPSGSYPVQLSATALNGCSSDTVSKAVLVHKNPTANFTMPDVCLADAFAQFTNQSTDEAGGALAYQWSFGDAANPTATSLDRDPRYRYSAVGNFPVKLSVTSAAGCTSDTTQIFTVNGSRPKAAFLLNASQVRCSDDSIKLRNASSVDFGKITKVEIYWKGDNDVTALTIDDDPTPDKEYTFSYAPFVTAGANSFSIRMLAYSGESCVHETNQEITIQRSPEVVFDPLNALCQDAAAFLLTSGKETTGTGGRPTYAGAGVNASGNFNPAIAGAGLHQITYQFVTTAGCTASDTQTIRVWPLPQLQAGTDKTVITGGSVTLNTTVVGEGLQFEWSPATWLSDPQVMQPVASPERDMVYTLKATSAQGCVAVDEVKVSVIPELFIPNAFTPNGDGINDTWSVPHLESLVDAEVRVFNRYGQEVYFAKGDARGWDGRIGGKEQPTGAFVYLVKMKGGKTLRGTIMLVR